MFRDRWIAVRAVAVMVALAASAGPVFGDGTGEAAKELPEALRNLRQGQSPAELDDETLQKLIELHRTEEEQVRMVLLPVSVTTRRGRIVRGLDQKDFRLFEDTVPQEIGYFAKENDQPVIVAFLLDVSGSMRQMGKLETAKKAIRYFVHSLGPEDRFALICFADEQVSWVTEFTSDRERFLKRLDVQEAFGRTAVNDAVAATPRLVDERIHGKKAIVMFSDGVDNASTVSPWKATRLARQVNVPIYVFGYSGLPKSAVLKGSTASNLRILGAFARETGGLLFPIHDPKDMRNAAAAVVEELRFQYVIGYYPVRKRWDGRFRRVRLETRRDSLEVRTRNGYYANP
jgi:Ca-activated chloride channel family protein